jgi:hypothetical protein
LETLGIKDVASALNVFEEAAIKHADATELGDYKTANKNAVKLGKAIDFIKKENQLHVLADFFTHHSDGVKSWAASFLLSIKEREATKVLEEVAKGGGIVAFSAEVTLSEWRDGNLKM